MSTIPSYYSPAQLRAIRDAVNGSNQVLANWVDHQIIRTSSNVWAEKDSWSDDVGDFWVGELTSIFKPAKPAAVPFNRLPGNAAVVYDMRGRRMSVAAHNAASQHGPGTRAGTLSTGVYVVQQRNENTFENRRMLIDR